VTAFGVTDSGTIEKESMKTCVNLRLYLAGLLFCAALPMATAPGFAADPAPAAEKKLVLKSDGKKDGVWCFHPAETSAPKFLRVLLIGDSIMNGYRKDVAKQLEGKANVDSWVMGLTLMSPELYDDLHKVVQQGPYDVVHFNIGLHGYASMRAGTYEPRLKAFVQILLDDAKGAKLIWASTTPISSTNNFAELDLKQNPIIVEQNTIAAKVMQEAGIQVDDLYGMMSDKLNFKRDRLHWKAAGTALQADAVAKIVTANLPKPEAGESK